MDLLDYSREMLTNAYRFGQMGTCNATRDCRTRSVIRMKQSEESAKCQTEKHVLGGRRLCRARGTSSETTSSDNEWVGSLLGSISKDVH